MRIVEDNRNYIKENINNMKEEAKDIVKQATHNEIKRQRATLKAIPKIYENMKNEFTVSNNVTKRRNEEKIANIGNHTLSGYAVSKRQENDNNYNKGLLDIDMKKQQEISNINSKINDLKAKRDMDLHNIEMDYNKELLDKTLKEIDRIDEYNKFYSNQDFEREKFNVDKALEWDKLKETARLNDSKILKNESDMMIDKNKDKREQEEHEINIKYLPNMLQAEIGAKNRSGVKTGSSGTKSSATSKISGKELANIAKEHSKVPSVGDYGEELYVVDKEKAKEYIEKYKKKYGISDLVVQDAYIYLGI